MFISVFFLYSLVYILFRCQVKENCVRFVVVVLTAGKET